MFILRYITEPCGIDAKAQAVLMAHAGAILSKTLDVGFLSLNLYGVYL